MIKLVLSFHGDFIFNHYHIHNGARSAEFRKGDKTLKINRFFALAAIALLVVGAMGALSMKVFAKGNAAPANQISAQVADCSQDEADGTEAQQTGPDTDVVELQCGDQNPPNGQETANDVDTDTTEVQEGDQNTPDTVEAQGVEEAESADGQDVAPSDTPAITTEQARAAALAVHPGTMIQTELDDENGQLIYSVEYEGSVDVKVDAMTGVILSTESGQD
jgi:uncharacterized membrane protein YkoI